MIKNKTYTYLFPELAKKIKIPEKYIKGVFLGIKGVSRFLEGNIFVWLSSQTPIINKNYVKNHTVGDGRIVEYVHPNKDTYDKIVKGQYSEIDKEAKKTIIKYHNCTNKDKLYQVLYKSPVLRKKMELDLKVDLKGYELGEKINPNKEIFKQNIT